MLSQKGKIKPFFLHRITFLFFFIFFIIGYQSNEWPIFLQMLPIYVSLIFLGLSHGAADHLCMWGLLSIKTPRIKLALIGIYFATALLYFLLWLLNPLISILLFFLLTIFHWGRADLYTSCFINNVDYLHRNKFMRFCYGFFRGSSPILLPVAFNQEVYLNFLNSLTFKEYQMFDFSYYVNFNLIFVPILFLTLYIVIFLVVNKNRKKNYRMFLWDLLENTLLIVWFLYVPVLWAIGIYFIFWHSLRHALRILSSDNKGAEYLNDFSLKKLSLRWIELTGLINLIALIGIFIIFNTEIFNINDEYNIFSNIMIGISILTLPHALLIEIIDIKYKRKHLID